MERIKLSAGIDIVDYVIINRVKCRGRKIFTNAETFKSLEKKALKTTTAKNNIRLELLNSKTGNVTEADFVREGTDVYWLKEISAKDLKPFAPIDTEKMQFISQMKK